MKVFFFIIIHDQQKGEQLVAHRPQLRILTPQGCNEPEELSADALSVRGFEHYRCDDYHLGMTLWLSLLTFSLLLLLWLLFFLYIKFNPLTATILCNSPYCLSYSSCDLGLENYVLDQLIIS